jgi:hypothetical protein
MAKAAEGASAAQVRLARVEAMLAGTKPWSRKIEDTLATELGVTVETIRRDKRTVLAAFRVRLGVDLEDRRAHMAARLETLFGEAAEAGRHGPAVAAARSLITLQGLDIPPPRAEEPDGEAEPEDELEALALRLRDTRRLRKSAERDGSYVPASNMLKLEADILGQITAEKRTRLAAAQGAASDADLFATIRDAIPDLKPEQLDELLAAIRAARS